MRSNINFGMSVKAASRAITIATAVNAPNKIVGMKFEKRSIEKPIVIVSVV